MTITKTKTITTLLSLSLLLSLSMSVNADDAVATDEGEKTYKAACFVCHATGVANAPKLGDKVAWAPRIALGIEALYTTALKGKGAMPAKGGRTDLSDDSVKAAVDYMVSKASDEAATPKKEEAPKTTEAPKKEETK